MLILAVLLSLASNSSVRELPGSYLSIESRPDGYEIALADLLSRRATVVEELQRLLPTEGALTRISCGEHADYRFCTVRLDGPAQVIGSNTNLPELGSWQVSFRGDAAMELIALLEATDSSEGVPGHFITNASGRIACEYAEKACAIHNYTTNVVSD